MKTVPAKDPKLLFRDFSDRFIPEIDTFMETFFRGKATDVEFPFMAGMYSLLDEYCSREGKRIRPLMLLATYQGYKKGRKELKEVVKLSAVIEMMHSFLLIQDDIIDKSELRRGKKSLHIISNEEYSHMTHTENIGSDIAIVLADVLFSNCLEIIAEAKMGLKVKNEFLKIFSRTYEMTAWGQVLDSLHSMPKAISVDENIPLQVSTLKTAYYTIYYPMLMGYVLAGRSSRREMDLIKNFTLPLGLAFQVRDDILGVFGKEKDIGKPSDSDIIEGKFTLLVQNTIETLKKNDREKFISTFTKQKKKKSEVKYIRTMIVESGALEKTRKKHGELLETAEECLIFLNIHDTYKAILSGVIEAVGEI
ncbi:MAG: polyprenyl synthetase family protein [bacterium]|nr:polyprenyl synthetase family protein [bacterium]